jgi:hypothetical protein
MAAASLRAITAAKVTVVPLICDFQLILRCPAQPETTPIYAPKVAYNRKERLLRENVPGFEVIKKPIGSSVLFR